jgi:CheY-like chemotaxis protein
MENKVWRSRAQKPGRILLDLYLPDMKGDEVIAKLRADYATFAIRVIMVKRTQPSASLKRLRRSGAQGYVTKPLDAKPFLQMVDRTLREAAGTKRNRHDCATTRDSLVSEFLRESFLGLRERRLALII